MKNPSLVAVACLFLCMSIDAQEQQGMTFMDIMNMNRVTNGKISPDGRSFLYTLSVPDWKKAKSYTDIWLVSTKEGFSSARQLTFSEARNESSVLWNTDNRSFFFLSDRNAPSGKTTLQLYWMRTDGGEARQITHEKEGVSDLSLSKDGAWIGYVSGKDEKKHLWILPTDSLTSAKPQEVTKRKVSVDWWEFAPDSRALYYTLPDSFETLATKGKEKKFDATIRNQLTSPRHLWTADIATLTERRLTEGQTYSVESVTLSQDGAWIGYRGIRNDRYERTITERNNHGDLYLLRTSDGSIERLTENDEISEGLPSFSPDGGTVAFSAPDDFTYFRNSRVYVRNTADKGKPFRKIGTGLDIDVTTGFWSDDGKTIYFNEGIGATNQLFALDVRSGAVTQVTRERGSVVVSYDPDHKTILVTFSSPTEPSNDYTVGNIDALRTKDRWTRLTDSNPGVAQLALGTVETVQWTSSDGATVEGVLVKPVGYKKGERYPLVVQIHGGPASATTLSFNASYGYYSHVYAAAGFVCLLPNYRGSSNYGETFRTSIVKDYFRQGYDDIMSGVDHLIRSGLVDSTRMGAMGWSAGGHWSNWILTHTDRFKAISSGAGAMNWTSMYAQSDVQRARAEYFGGLPYDNFDEFWDVSPLKYIKNARTPTLIHVVDGDPRVPSPQSEELHMALRQLGVPTEFIVYPGSTHGITQARNQLFKMVTEFRWMDKWLNGREHWLNWNELLDMVKDAEKEPEKE